MSWSSDGVPQWGSPLVEEHLLFVVARCHPNTVLVPPTLPAATAPASPRPSVTCGGGGNCRSPTRWPDTPRPGRSRTSPRCTPDAPWTPATWRPRPRNGDATSPPVMPIRPPGSPDAGHQPRVRPARGRKDVVETCPDLCDLRPAPPTPSPPRNIGTGALSSGTRSPPHTSTAEDTEHTAVRAERGDVPPRASTPPDATQTLGGTLGARNRLGPDRLHRTGAGGHDASLSCATGHQPPAVVGVLHRDHPAAARRARVRSRRRDQRRWDRTRAH
ncbi:hypothetical protein Rruber_05619 (plasmid) [Rhodococcus ruber]